jgi:hypothetical protein
MNPVQELTTLANNAPASNAAGTVNGAAIDYSATYEAEATVVLVLGVLGASATVQAILQESADGSTGWQAVATTATAVKATDDNKVFTATGRTTLRYVRTSIIVGTATSICGATILCKRRVIT